MIETLAGVRELLRHDTEGELPLDPPVVYAFIAAVSAVKAELDDRWERE